jgi:mannose-6-phosphate isomerase
MDYQEKIPKSKPPVKYVERPWGSFKQFVSNSPCTVSLMVMMPGQRLSLQSHIGRAELWIVLDDGAVIQVGDEIATYMEGDEIWIPFTERHRLSSRSDQPIRVLEVAFGQWEQEDITRYDDDYKRQK